MPATARVGRRDVLSKRWLDKGAELRQEVRSSGVETVIAAVENHRDHLIAESADLLFHLLVGPEVVVVPPLKEVEPGRSP